LADFGLTALKGFERFGFPGIGSISWADRLKAGYMTFFGIFLTVYQYERK